MTRTGWIVVAAVCALGVLLLGWWLGDSTTATGGGVLAASGLYMLRNVVTRTRKGAAEAAEVAESVPTVAELDDAVEDAASAAEKPPAPMEPPKSRHLP